MKKITLGLCLFFFTASFANTENEMEEFEIELEEIDGHLPHLPPIFVNITVSNIQNAQSSNKTNICQKQEVEQKIENQDHQKRTDNTLHYALLALLLASEDDDAENWWGATW